MHYNRDDGEERVQKGFEIAESVAVAIAIAAESRS